MKQVVCLVLFFISSQSFGQDDFQHQVDCLQAHILELEKTYQKKPTRENKKKLDKLNELLSETLKNVILGQ